MRKKLSSKLCLSILSSTSPMEPAIAVPAFDIRISTPPYFSLIILNAFFTLFLFLTSQCNT